MTDQTVILKIIPVLSADGLSNIDSPGGGSKGGRTTDTINPTSVSNKGAGGSSIMGKFMAGVGFAPAAAGIAAAVTIIMQIMKDMSWALKPVMSAVSAIAKMLGVIFVPVMQALMMLLVPILQMLRPMITMLRVMMKPFEDIMRRAQRLMVQAMSQHDTATAGAAALVGFSAMLAPLTSFFRTIILDLMADIIGFTLTAIGTFLSAIGSIIPGFIGDIFSFLGGTLTRGAGAVTDLLKSLIDIGEEEVRKQQLKAMDSILTGLESHLASTVGTIGTTVEDSSLTAGEKANLAVDTFITDIGDIFSDEENGLPSLASGILEGFNTGILTPVDNFITKLKERANAINNISVKRAPKNWFEETAAKAYVGYSRLTGNDDVEVIRNTNTSGAGSGAR